MLTYQKVPTFIDDCMIERLSSRLVSRGCADASKGNMPTDFDSWLQELWFSIGGEADDSLKDVHEGLKIEILT